MSDAFEDQARAMGYSVAEVIVPPEVATYATRTANLMNNRDMWKGQCERQAAELTELRTKATLLEQTIQNGAEMIRAAHARAEAAEAERDRLRDALKAARPFVVISDHRNTDRVLKMIEAALSSTTESQT